MNYTTGNWSHCSRWLTAVLVLGLLAPVGTARAQATAATVTCKDGTASTTTGKGACSHHGGVAAAGATAPTPAAPATPAAVATGAAATVTCKDGTTSTTTGKGACSHHGGVGAPSAGAPAAKVTTTTPPTKLATAPAPAVAPAPAAAPKTVVASSAGKAGSSETTDPTGAIAQCKDGLYSHSKTHSGACSRHGGVVKWLDGTTK